MQSRPEELHGFRRTNGAETHQPMATPWVDNTTFTRALQGRYLYRWLRESRPFRARIFGAATTQRDALGYRVVAPLVRNSKYDSIFTVTT